jgi:GNAT superfamily N-acetyltransferase
MSDQRIFEVSPDDADGISAIRELFAEYAEWLAPLVRHTTIAEELASLPAPFVRPEGCLLVARSEDGAICGCVGVKRGSELACEIKRLYVRPGCRGQRLGEALFSAALEAACEMGYSAALVSTIPSRMPVAAAMYDRLGFVPTERFERHTHADVELAFLRLDLVEWCGSGLNGQ